MTNKYEVVCSTDFDLEELDDIYLLLKSGKRYYYVIFSMSYTPFTCGMHFIGNMSQLHKISKIDKEYYDLDGSLDYDSLLHNVCFVRSKPLATFPKAAAEAVLDAIREEFSFAYLLASDITGAHTSKFCRAAGFKATERITNPNSGNKIQLFYKTLDRRDYL